MRAVAEALDGAAAGPPAERGAPPADADAWIGRTHTTVEPLSARSVAGLLALLDRPVDAADLLVAPPLAHWLVGPDTVPQSRLGADGHPARGGLLPPIALPRRMWAASSVRWHAPLMPDVALTRRSRIAAVRHTAGRSGPLAFVDVEHGWTDAAGQALLTEAQTIVYRAAPAATAAAAAQPARDAGTAAALHWPLQRDLVPGTTLLFRYAALTFNGHRIHYDAAYAREVEGYPALVVQGPLIATLLADLCRRHSGGRRFATFSFRAQAPAFVDAPLRLRGAVDGDAVQLKAFDAHGTCVLSAEATLAT